MSVQLRDDQNRPSASGVKSLPEGWLIKPLGEVVTRIIGGGTPSRENPEFWKGDIPWLTVKDMRTTRPADAIDHISKNAVGESSTNIIPADTVIIATRVGLGKVIRVPYEAAINQDLKALIVPSTIEKSFLEYWFLSIASYLESIGSGTTVKGIRLEQLKALEMPVPSPKDQRRIVAEIEKQFTRLEAGVAALRRVQANLKRYRAAVLKAACEGRLVPTEAELHRKLKTKNSKLETGAQLLARILIERRQNWQGRGQYKEPAALDTTNLPLLPEGWTWASVGQLGEIKGGKRLPMGHNYSPTPTRFPYIRVVDFENYGVRQDDLKFLREETQREIQRYTISKNDIYISIADSIGFVGVVPDNLDGANLTENAAKITSLSFVERKYICFWLSSNAGRSFVADKTIATTQPKLALFRIEVIPIPLPPLAEQTRIVAEVERRLSVVEELESVVSANLQRATRLRQSILQQAFSGKL